MAYRVLSPLRRAYNRLPRGDARIHFLLHLALSVYFLFRMLTDPNWVFGFFLLTTSSLMVGFATRPGLARWGSVAIVLFLVFCNLFLAYVGNAPLRRWGQLFMLAWALSSLWFFEVETDDGDHDQDFAARRAESPPRRKRHAQKGDRTAKLALGDTTREVKYGEVLDLSDQVELTALPAGIVAEHLDLTGCCNLEGLPPDLRVRRVILDGCERLRALPDGLTCYYLSAVDSSLEAIPTTIDVKIELDLSGCRRLRSLPANLTVGRLVLRSCTGLERLPQGLSTRYLDVSRCENLVQWPKNIVVRSGGFVARDCVQLTALPECVGPVAHLDIRGCTGIESLPNDLRVFSWIDLGGTQVSSLPDSVASIELRWRGARVEERLITQPETITLEEIQETRNVEVRRALLDRYGMERFVRDSNAKVLDSDTDVGGPRELLSIELPHDEPLVCVTYQCPSTGRQYITRVPPRTRTCHQAVAWIAGFNDPDDYKLIAES